MRRSKKLLRRSKHSLTRMLAIAVALAISSQADAIKVRSGSYGGLVVDGTGKPVSGAQVLLVIPSSSPRSAFTSEKGLFFIDGVESRGGTQVVVSAPGYRVKTLSLSGAEQTQSQSPPLDQIELKPSGDGAQRTIRKQTPPLESGWGAGWSGWYQVCSEPLAAKEEIVATRFQLQGDRTCGAWSECRESERTPTRSCWQFRMQGHSERAFGAGAVGRSWGILEIDVRSASSVPTGANARSIVFLIASDKIPAQQVNTAIGDLRSRGFGVAEPVTIGATFPSAIKVFGKKDLEMGEELARGLKSSIHVSLPIELETTSSFVRAGTVQVWLGAGASAR